MQLGEMTTVTYQLVTKNGTSIYLQTQGSPIFDHDGTISQYHCENQINEYLVLIHLNWKSGFAHRLANSIT